MTNDAIIKRLRTHFKDTAWNIYPSQSFKNSFAICCRMGGVTIEVYKEGHLYYANARLFDAWISSYCFTPESAVEKALSAWFYRASECQRELNMLQANIKQWCKVNP